MHNSANCLSFSSAYLSILAGLFFQPPLLSCILITSFCFGVKMLPALFNLLPFKPFNNPPTSSSSSCSFSPLLLSAFLCLSLSSPQYREPLLLLVGPWHLLLASPNNPLHHHSTAWAGPGASSLHQERLRAIHQRTLASTPTRLSEFWNLHWKFRQIIQITPQTCLLCEMQNKLFISRESFNILRSHLRRLAWISYWIFVHVIDTNALSHGYHSFGIFIGVKFLVFSIL